MFGLREEFPYLECGKCGGLQIKEIPDNLSKYYPRNYYSFSGTSLTKKPQMVSFLRRKRATYCITGRNDPLGFLIRLIKGKPGYFEWFRKTGTGFDAKVLDVGCGSGELLLTLSDDGFKNLIGVDPHIERDIFYNNGVRIYKKDVSQLESEFDFIMLNHSFEHMSDPLEILKLLHNLIRPEKFVLIRTPVACSYAWKTYNSNWVQLDAPRHFFLHTEKTMHILSRKAGFDIAEIVYDSTEFQFWGSEQYAKNIPLRDKRSYAENPEGSIFSKEKIEKFKKRAQQLNRNGEGDSACFYLRKSY